MYNVDIIWHQLRNIKEFNEVKRRMRELYVLNTFIQIVKRSTVIFWIS